MSDLKISQLPSIAVALGTDLYATVQSDVTKQGTVNQLRDYMIGAGLSDILSFGADAGAYVITLTTEAPNKILVTDGSSKLVASSVAATQLGYIANVTSDIQTQLNALQTGLTWKSIVEIIADAPIALTGTYTLQGYPLQVGDRVLPAAQGSAVNNGIYVVSAGAWTRATDFDGSGDQMQGAVVPCKRGTYADKAYVCTNTGTIVVGSTAITFTIWGGTTYTGTTNRISVSGNVIDIDSAYVGQNTITTFGTITTGTLGSGTKILVGSDATGDIWFNGGSGAISRSSGFSWDAANNALCVRGPYQGWAANIYATSSVMALDSSVGSGGGTHLALLLSGSVKGYIGATPTQCLTIYDSTANHLWFDINNSTGVTTLNDVITKSAVPTIVAGTGAGTTPTISISGTNKGGVINLTTGASPAVSGIVATITFSGALSAPNDIIVSITPRNSNGVIASSVYAVKVNATSWKIVEGTGLGLAGATNYLWNYVTEVN